MTYLRSLPDAPLPAVLATYPRTGGPLLDYHQALLRGPSPLSVAERELIAAYVSALNSCDYCHGIHAQVAEDVIGDELTVALGEDGREIRTHEEHVEPAE